MNSNFQCRPCAVTICAMDTGAHRVRRRTLRAFSHSQRGVVLLVVVMLVFLMVTLLAFMVEDQQLLMRRVSNQNIAEQGYQYAQGANAWAMQLLHDDQDRTSDHQKEDWARIGELEPTQSAEEERRFSLERENAEEVEPLPRVDFGGIPVDFFILDLQGRYNLNNLATTTPAAKIAHKQIFFNILEVIGVTELAVKDQLHDSLVDWIDSNDLELPFGRESGSYTSTDVPYYASDQKLSSLGELRFVQGFTPQIIADLEPFVTVLPAENVPLNINSASAEVLAALSPSPQFSTAGVAAFVALRNQPEFLGYTPADISLAENAIIQASALEPQAPFPGTLSAASQFYQINVKIRLDQSVYCMRTIVFREAGKANSDIAESMRVLHREYDSLCLNHRPLGATTPDDLS